MKYPIKLKDKIRFICKALYKPYYIMTRITIGTYMFEVFDGTDKGNPINWTGHSPANAVDEALEYLKHEIEMGAVEMPSEIVADQIKKEDKLIQRKKRVLRKRKK